MIDLVVLDDLIDPAVDATENTFLRRDMHSLRVAPCWRPVAEGGKKPNNNPTYLFYACGALVGFAIGVWYF